MFVLLRRTNPEEHMDRWYLVLVQATLLEPVAVICAWGNRQNAYQQLRILPAESWAEAQAWAQRIVEQKLKRGYQLVYEELPHKVT